MNSTGLVASGHKPHYPLSESEQGTNFLQNLNGIKAREKKELQFPSEFFALNIGISYVFINAAK